jgi:hypothetical protein
VFTILAKFRRNVQNIVFFARVRKKLMSAKKFQLNSSSFAPSFFFAGVKKTKDKDVSLKTKLRDMKNNGVSTTVVFMENTSLL